MNIPFVDLKLQYEQHREALDAAMASVIERTAFIGTSGNEFVQRFEADFAAFAGTKHCVGCANGTDALEILLKAAGIGPGDEVLVPALTWISTAEAASSIGARPVFVDVDPDTNTIDPADLERRVTSRTRAVIPVHLYGLPADMDAVMAFAERHGLFVLEDCAQAHGALFRGRKVGTIGNAGSFSFFPGKNLGAYGDAGGIITNHDALAARARMITQHGQSGRKFQHDCEGRNSRLDGIQAAVLGVKLPHLQDWTEARIRVAARYRELLDGSGLELPDCPEERRHVYHLFAVRVAERDRVREALAGKGIATGLQYPTALPFLDAYADRRPDPEDFPVARRQARMVLTLPIYPEITEDQIAYVAEHLLAAL